VVSDHSPCTADLKRFDTGDFGQVAPTGALIVRPRRARYGLLLVLWMNFAETMLLL
jgi:hypothetical protein